MRSRVIKYLLVICLVFATFIIMGLGCAYIPRNLEESKARTVMYKPDEEHYAGQMAVCWHDRIYYVSAESGNDGIHSMKPDGSDVRFEFKVPKITRLIAMEDAFYYVGVYKIQEKNHQLFALFKKPHGSAEVQQLPTVYEYADSVYDAYIAQDGIMVVLETHYIGTSIPPVEILEFVNIIPEVVVNWDASYFDEGEPNSTNLFIYNTSSLIYSTSITGNDNEMSNATLVDSTIGAQVMSSISNETMNYIKLLYVKKHTLVFGEYDSLVLMDQYTREKYKKIVVENIEEDMWIDYVFECDNGFMAIAKQENRNNDKLFFINTDTEETAELMKLNDKVLIDVRENKVLYAQGNFIRCQAVNELSLGDMIYEIRMPENVMCNNVFEIAGDWLFIHKHVNNVEWATNQLLYKINLKTQEVIDVR